MRMFKFQSECKWESTLTYRSPSESSEQFDIFLQNFDLLLDNIANRNRFVTIIIGDFNARSRN